MVKETKSKIGKEKNSLTALLHDYGYTYMNRSQVQSDISHFSLQISPIKVHP